MPGSTGAWGIEDLIYHDYSFPLARWIAKFFGNKYATIIDAGAGDGFYSGYLQDLGFKKVIPIEADKNTVVNADGAIEQDLSVPFQLTDYHNTLCLEVAEHIPAQFETIVMDNISGNTKDKLVLSWAVPDQAGHYHVNCRENAWVINEFTNRGFIYLPAETESARAVIEERRKYFRETLLVFEKL